MQTARNITFGRFRLDATNECLWQGERAIALRPKAFAVLKLLVDQAGSLVTKQQVLDTVWPGTFVGDAVLKDCIRQLRDALEDDAAAPSYIETSHRRGYRFIGKPNALVPASPQSVNKTTETSQHAVLSSPFESPVGVLGRAGELKKLGGWLNRALAGERQLVFVTGEAGIGKTTLVQALQQKASELGEIVVARGQCLEHYGAGEAYMPVLDAFSRLGRSDEDGAMVECFRQNAPTWLAQMPSLVPPAERESLQAQALGTTRERMLREMADAVESLARRRPLMLVLEDLHWSDFSTIDLISYLARRRDPARLMIVATYRPVEVILDEHPVKSVKQELQAHGLCNELLLEYLSEKTVSEYLAARFPGHQFFGRLAHIVHRRTEGNPLFMVNVVEYLLHEGLIFQDEGTWRLPGDLAQVESAVPENLKQLIEKQIDRLNPDERAVLEGASVVGMECSSVAIAAGLNTSTEWVEKQCEELARRHRFLSPPWLVELPDGTMTPRHRFTHILYLEVPYRLIPPMRRAQIHHRIAERGVTVYGDRVGEIAAELAMHFEQSRDWPRALQYLLQAAGNATARSAHHEASGLAARGLKVVKVLPETPERAKQEISLRMILGVSLMAIKGFASAEVETVYERGRELFWLQGPSPELFHMLWSLNLYYQFGGDLNSSLAICEQLLQLAEGLGDGPLIMEAHRALGAALLVLGRCEEALKNLDEASALYASHGNHGYALFIGLDCKVISECFAGKALWALGYPDQAAERTERALAFARQLARPQTLVVASHFAAQLHQLRGEVELVRQRAQEAVDLADEYGLELWLAYGLIELGWAEAESGETEKGIPRMQRGIAAYEATGARLWSSFFLQLLADQLAKVGRAKEGMETIAKALAYVERSGERYSLPELYRVKGELLTKCAERQAGAASAEPSLSPESCFTQALNEARQQGAKAWELRAAISLNCIPGREKPVRECLASSYAWFKEGHDTADLQRARMILNISR